MDYNENFSAELIGVNESQLAAINYDAGAAFCIAGPGSGKTRVITLRALRLLSEYGDDNAVLTLAFNRQAAEEMKKRAEDYGKKYDFYEKNAKKLKFCTIHKYAYEIINEYYNMKNLTPPKVIEETYAAETVKNIYKSVKNTQYISSETMKILMAYLENEGASASCEEDFAEIGEKYGEFKKERGLVDFNDMIVGALGIMRNDGNFNDKVKKRFRFLQVDEAQDLSPIQIDFIKSISGENIFYVADDDQSIYGFRGARPEVLSQIVKSSGTKRFILDKNYRSGSVIVDIATRFVEQNRVRFPKKLVADNVNSGVVKVKTYANVKKQAVSVAKLICKRVREGKTCAVLYRNNVSGILPLCALYFEAKKQKIDIGATIMGENTLISDIPILRAIADYINVHKEVKSPGSAVRNLRRNGLYDNISFGVFSSGKRKFIGETLKDCATFICERSLDAKSVMENAEKIDSLSQKTHVPIVTFSTVHSSKGLEFDTVIITDCVEGEFPYGDMSDEKTEAEERRLMYVAMTRAKSELIITFPRVCGEMTLKAGKFIYEICENL